jgi:uncharacterized DUF497 family protein
VGPRQDPGQPEEAQVSFEEAVSVFSDENALVIPDPDHSIEEERFVLLGMIWSLRVLVVCHCFRESETTIRIFLARKATKTERLQYGVKP